MPTIVNSPLLLTPMAATLLASLAVLVLRRHPNAREGASFAGALLAFAGVILLAGAALGGEIKTFTASELLPGVKLSFCADGLSLVFALVATFLWGLATFYNIGYMRSLKEHAQTRYYFCFAVSIFGALGVAFAANIFTLYLFYEIITIFTYPLVAHHQDREGFLGGRKYLVYLMGTSKLFLLAAMIITYSICGTLDFRLGDVTRGIFPPDVAAEYPNMVRVAYFLFLAGIGKAALVPLHNWLPSAMVAPTPVSALLHAVAVVKAGVFSICRIILSGFGVETMQSLGLSLPTSCVAGATILIGSLIALTKDDIKARLAYSTISQLSYVIIGVALLTPMAVQGGLMHIAHHAFSKITLFFGAGAIYVATGVKAVSAMNGLGRRMPFTFGAFALASLSMIGIPPVAGFVSKWYLGQGAVDAGFPWLMGLFLLSSALNAAYFAPIVFRAYFLKSDAGAALAGGTAVYDRATAAAVPRQEAPATMVVPLCVTGAVSVVLGILPWIFQDFILAFSGKF